MRALMIKTRRPTFEARKINAKKAILNRREFIARDGANHRPAVAAGPFRPEAFVKARRRRRMAASGRT